MGFEGVGNKDINIIVGEVVEGLLVILLLSFDQKVENQELVKVFESKGEDFFGLFVLIFYVVVQLIVNGIEQVEFIDLFDVVEVLCSNVYEMLIGIVEYDQVGDMKVFEFVVYEWYLDGSKILVN